MESLLLGPVELLVTPLAEDRPDPRLFQRLFYLVNSGTVRVLDFVLARWDGRGAVQWEEVDAAEFDLAGVGLLAQGIASAQDIREALARAGPGSWAVIVIEHAWLSPQSQGSHPGAHLVSVASVEAYTANAVLQGLRHQL
jgi:hypothetical protein